MVDKAVLARKLSAIRDAVTRIRDVLPASVDEFRADRLAASAGLRNLIAHQYGVVNVDRVFVIAASDLDDLLSFCQQLAERATDE